MNNQTIITEALLRAENRAEAEQQRAPVCIVVVEDETASIDISAAYKISDAYLTKCIFEAQEAAGEMIDKGRPVAVWGDIYDGNCNLTLHLDRSGEIIGVVLHFLETVEGVRICKLVYGGACWNARNIQADISILLQAILDNSDFLVVHLPFDSDKFFGFSRFHRRIFGRCTASHTDIH